MSTSNKLDPVQYPGKTYESQQFRLCLLVEPGSMINWETWIPATESKKMFNMPYETLLVEAWYDGINLIPKTSVTNNIKVDIQLPDDHENCNHQLEIKLTGKDHRHTVDYGQGNSAVGMVKIQVFIEDLPINYCLEELNVYLPEDSNTAQPWAEYMGQNGTQQIPVSTPIYTWLVNKQQNIISEIKSQFRQKD